jgi:hypothetical protein
MPPWIYHTRETGFSINMGVVPGIIPPPKSLVQYPFFEAELAMIKYNLPIFS